MLKSFLFKSYRKCYYSKLYSQFNETIDETLVNNLYNDLIKGNRSSLAKSITLVESALAIKKETGQKILLKVMNYLKEISNGKSSNSFRIGLSGPPGAGKSTFIEAFGMYLINKGHKIAVLAVDPSSKSTGGSLMGDKTRMPELTLSKDAYIRPTPSGGNLGGVARNTNEAIVLCEGAGYDIVFVETMGVGQSEFAVADMVDIFCLLLPPAGGDELQGLKRGIVEMADVVVVNKFDGDLKAAARRVATEYVSALKFMRRRHPQWNPKVYKVSSYEKTGLEDLWSGICEFQKIQRDSGRLESIRCEQRLEWMWSHVKEQLIDQFHNNPRVQTKFRSIQQQVRDGSLSSGRAADLLIEANYKIS